LNAAGTTGYRINGSEIQRLNVSRFLAGSSIELPDTVLDTGNLTMSPNGRWLVAPTERGAVVVEL